MTTTMAAPSPASRSQWVVSTLRCVAYCVTLSLWTQKVLLDPLKVTAIEMAHMDPSEIIAVPLPINDVVTFVGFSCLTLFLVTVSWWDGFAILWTVVRRIVTTTLIMLGTFILCGAHPIHNITHTLWAALYTACLLLWRPNDDNKKSRHHVNTILLVAIPFQILNILDTGLQVQRWPIPILIGGSVGWIVSNLFACALDTNSILQKVP